MPDDPATFALKKTSSKKRGLCQALERWTVGESRDLSDSNGAGEPRPGDEARRAEDRDRKGSPAGRGRGTQNGDADHSANPSQHSQTVNSSDGVVPENPVYGALDLGTNNCRLLLARPTRRGFRVIDAFSRIIRLGEGVAQSGRLSDAAMRRTTDALRVCASKIERNGVHRARLVATEACRIAENGEEFLSRVQDRLGLDIEILTTETEARLAVSGCASLIDSRCDYVLVFDIGGGSSELIWLDLSRLTKGRGRTLDRLEAQDCMSAWTSLPVGVVTLAEHFGGKFVTEKLFEAMVDHVIDLLAPFEQQHRMQERLTSRSMHFLGTSGTVTTVAGIQLGLPRYDRNRVDGCWLSVADARAVTYDLVGQSYQERIAQPCIGRDRADLVLAGCAILEALIRMWPCERMRVADRGLREGILATLMLEDGVYRARRRSGRRRAR
jgi:exopolyphosphatase / guanosine-5'-triphosphate,3'-diphosphate pyrophosphatase